MAALLSASVSAETDASRVLRQAQATVCEDPSASAEAMAAGIPGATAVGAEALQIRGAEAGWKRRFALPGGAEVRVHRFAPRDRLRRLTVQFWSPDAQDGMRPLVAGIADSSCAFQQGRRLRYEPGYSQPRHVEYLDGDLEPTGEREPRNPPVPDGTDPGGVAVALVDSGVNYRLPDIARRLARDPSGAILGRDFWDMDGRPFDSHPARSPFFVQRHGTRTASVLLREAEQARLVPYRYPRPDMSRMRALIEDAADKDVAVVNLSMGSGDRDDWEAFAAAARAQPDMLFVLSAGNDGRDIDQQPLYPSAMQLDNVIVATSSLASGELARGSNWGSDSVDLLVPAEHLRATAFEGGVTAVSGSSYAAPRIAALAARLLQANPEWGAPELKRAIFARVLPPFAGASGQVAEGFMPRPDKAEHLPPLAADGEPRERDRRVFEEDAIYPDGSPHGAEHAFEPTFAWFGDGAWHRDRLRDPVRKAARILGQCGIQLPRIDLRVLDGPAVYRYFHEATGRELVRRLDLPKPTVYFVADTLQIQAYDAEAIGKGNSATRPELRYTVWFTDQTRDPGIALAHELVHILMDSGAHVDTSGNLMQGETIPTDTRLTAEQCKAVIAQGTHNGLLRSAAGRGNRP